MTSIDTIVKVSISAQSQAVPQRGFGVPIILGTTGFDDDDIVRSYTDLAGVLEDFDDTDKEYLAAVKLLEQELSPDLFMIGKVAGATIDTDIASIQRDGSDDWYAAVLTGDLTDPTQIATAAAYIETQKKIMIVQSDDVNTLDDDATSDLAYILKGQSYKRTGLIYNGSDAYDDRAAAWVGGQIPQTPGSNTWKFKNLVGVTADSFTAAERLAAIGNAIAGVTGKNANIYEQVGGVAIVEEGFMSGGQFIDQTIGIDWLESTIQTNIYTLLVQNPKVPYTDQGGAVIENAIRQAIQQGVKNGLIDGESAIVVTVPKVLSETTGNRAARILADVKFSCRLAGALHFVVVDGVVSV